jgi:chromosome segregation ATPase
MPPDTSLTQRLYDMLVRMTHGGFCPDNTELAEIQRLACEEADCLIQALRQEVDDGRKALGELQARYVNTRESLRAQLGGAERRAERAEAEVGALRQELKGDEVEIVSLRQQVRDFAEREAECCPEDVGFEEAIASLRSEVGALRRALDAAQPEITASRTSSGGPE